MRTPSPLSLGALAALCAGCSLVIDAGSYRGREDGGTLDATTLDAGMDAATDGAADAATDCSPACSPGELCLAGACRCGVGDGCSDGEACCDGACTPLGTTTACAACNDICDSPARATGSCEGGTCSVTCDDGFADCETGDPDCEQSLSTPSHCGDCGAACAVGELCGLVAGVATCVGACPVGQTDCSGSCVDTASHVLHCGRCDNACPEPASGSASCVDSACEVGCDPGFLLCSGACAAAQSYWPDADGDGFGDGTAPPVDDCPGATPSGYSATNDDCDDRRSSVNPLGTETCDGTNEDCDLTIDEGFPCSGSDTQPCTASVGSCVVSGTQTCVACDWGECVGADVCDRTDDDCDGFVDEGGLRAGARARVAPLSGYRFGLVRGDYDPNRREVGIVFSGFDGTSHTLYFARLDAATGALVGSVGGLTSGSTGYGIAFDGAHWSVAVSTGSGTHLYRVSSATGVATRVYTLDTTYSDVSVARLGTSGSNIVVAWAASNRGRLGRFTMPASASAAPTPIGPPMVEVVSSGYTHLARAVTTSAGALLFFLKTASGSAPYDLHVGAVSTTSVGSFPVLVPGTVSDVFPAYDPTTDTVGVALTTYIATVNRAAFRTLDASGATISPEVALSGTGAAGLVYSGEPGQLAIFSGMFFPASGDLVRARLTDRTLLSTPPLSVGGFNGMVGVPEGPARAIYFEDDGTDLYAFPVVCP